MLERRLELAEVQAEVLELGDERVVVGDHAFDILRPRPAPQLLVVIFFELGKLGVDAGLDRPLAQQASAERVDRAQETALDPRDGLGEALVLDPGRLARGLLEPELKPSSQLGGGLARERHRRQLVDRASAGSRSS